MRRFISMFMCALLLLSLIKEQEGKRPVDPTEFVPRLIATMLDIENFFVLELRMEDIVANSNLTEAPEDEKSDIQEKLQNDPEVQEIMKECKAFLKPPNCTDSPYRNADGSCNNEKHPNWGRALIGQERLFTASYEGIYRFRRASNGEDLPPPREISNKLKPRDNPTKIVSALFTIFGQFLIHDISLAPDMTLNQTLPDCCSPQLKNNESICASAFVTKDDPYYSQFNFTCELIVRSIPFPKCDFDKRLPIQSRTSFIDVSDTYGINDTITMSLRSNDGTGRLKSQNSMFGELLPKNTDKLAVNCPIAQTSSCFVAGDDRVNQHTMLSVVHTIYMRLHNIIADYLKEVNPHWDDEKLFQESRRLVIAINQRSVYGEYLPHLIGPNNMEKFDLYINFEKRSSYNETTNPTTLIECTTAAFRLHSMIPKRFSKFNPDLEFYETYSNSKLIHDGHLTQLLLGSTEVPSQQNDQYEEEDVSDFLFKVAGASYGFDLISIDIARGRDHGLRPYVDAVEYCSDGEDKIKEFSDLSSRMTNDNIELLKGIYNDVSDIDMYIGMITEKPLQNSVTGSTAACILGLQFNRLKFGDRFFFTHMNGAYPFTEEQMRIIKDISFARVICETTNTEVVRRYPLLIPSKENPLVPCKSFGKIDMTPWKEEEGRKGSSTWLSYILSPLIAIFSILISPFS